MNDVNKKYQTQKFVKNILNNDNIEDNQVNSDKIIKNK